MECYVINQTNSLLKKYVLQFLWAYYVSYTLVNGCTLLTELASLISKIARLLLADSLALPSKIAIGLVLIQCFSVLWALKVPLHSFKHFSPPC